MSYIFKITYGFVKKHTTQKVIEDFTDLRMAHDILFMALNELIFTHREVLKNLVIKIDFA
jgi:hypothetical protein